MSPGRTVLAALVLALSACEQPSAVAVDMEPAFAKKGRVVESVNGSWNRDSNRTFTVTARRYADGSLAGQWVRVNRFRMGVFQRNGIVLCMTIIGNEAWIGTRTVGGDRDGREGGVRVVDNGEGMNSPSDEITLHRLSFRAGFAADYCADQEGARGNQRLFTIRDFGSGQIQVRP